MRRKLLITLTIVTLAAAGALAGWGDFIKGALQATSSAPRRTGGTAAVRGLSGDGKDSGASDAAEDKREFGALDRLDKKIPSDQEVDAFVQEGGLEK